MKRFLFAGLCALALSPLFAERSLAGGNNPLPCSQGNEIRTIDYYMDLNMEELQAINENQMDETTRQQLVAANTDEFMQLQEHRDVLIIECGKEIRARDDYWKAQGLNPEDAPAESAPLDPESDQAATDQNAAGGEAGTAQ